MQIRVPGNVYYNGYMATRELLRCVERAGTTNNIEVIKELEGRKVSARDRMQHFDAYMNPATHQLQQTIYMATYNDTAGGEGRHLQDPRASCRRRRSRTRTRRRPASSRSYEATPSYEHVAHAQARSRRPLRRRSDCLLNLLPHLVNGVSLGLLFALIALGFMLIVGVMETINLAHGSLFALGMYVALFVDRAEARLRFPSCSRRGTARCRSARATASRCCSRRCSSGVFGMLLELCMRRTYGKDPLYGLLLTFGAALVIEELIRVVWGSNEKQLPLPDAISGAFMLGDLIYAQVPALRERLRDR